MKNYSIFLAICLMLFSVQVFANVKVPARDITTNTTGFDTILSNEETDVQKALDVLDDVIATGGTVSNEPYGSAWDGVETVAPSKNTVYDKIESMPTGAASLGDLSDVGIATQGAGRLLISDGTYFQGIAISGDISLSASGVGSVNWAKMTTVNATGVNWASFLTSVDSNVNWSKHDNYPAACSAGQYVSAIGDTNTCGTPTDTGATSLTGLSDVGSATVTAGRILVADGTKFQSTSVTGDITISSSGVTAVQANSVALGTDTTGGYAASSTEGGAATTATALASNGGNCSAGQYPLGVDASGAVESCTADADTFAATTKTDDSVLVGNGSAWQNKTLPDCANTTTSKLLYNPATNEFSCGTDQTAGTGATSLGDLSDVGTATATAGNLLIADGTNFQGVAMSGDVLISSSGVTSVQPNSVTLGTDTTGGYAASSTEGGAASSVVANVIPLTDLSDVGSTTATAGWLLVANGSSWESVGVTGDVTITSGGVTNIAANTVGPTELISTAVTAGSYTVANITVDQDGRLTSAARGSLASLSDMGTTTATAGHLLVANGTTFQSVAVSGDATLASNGALTIATDTVPLSKLSDVGTATATAGRLLIADGSNFQGIAMGGDAEISSAGTVILQDLQRGFGRDQPSSTLDVAKTVFIPTVPITISGMKCISQEGTSTAVKLTDGANDMTTVTCTTSVTGATFSSNNTFNANEPVKFTVTTVTGAVTYFYGQFTYERTP